jgi:hypothetical protein
VRVIVEAQDIAGARMNELDCRAEIRTPQGETTSVVLQATAPGRYEGRAAARDRGAYVLAISAVSADRRFEGRALRGVYWSAEREYQAAGNNIDLLTRMTEVSGGRVLSDNDSPFAGPRDSAFVDAWPWLAAAGLVLFLAEVLLPARFRARGGSTGDVPDRASSQRVAA